GLIKGLTEVVKSQKDLIQTRAGSANIRLVDTLKLPKYDPDNKDVKGDWESFVIEWERVILLTGDVADKTKMEMFRQSMVGSAKSVADVYVKSVKPTYVGLKKFLYKAYGLTDQQRKVLAFKKYRSLKLKSQATVSDVKIFLANWELYGSELESLKISFDESQKIIDFMNALPVDVRRFISLQPKEVELMTLEEIGMLVKRFYRFGFYSFSFCK
ncbi:hypothetical protein Pmar_PMAR018160, partial [Perkinsus marinus ATCC 50983]